MNIKRAKEVIEKFKETGLASPSTIGLVESVINALDEPPESIGEISSRFYNENRQLKIDLDLANADIETFNKEIERLKEVITALQKMPSGLHMFQKLQDERDKLYGEIAIANGLVKNLEEQLASRKVCGVPVVTKLEYNTLRTKFENYIMTVENIVKKYEQELRKEINHGTY